MLLLFTAALCRGTKFPSACASCVGVRCPSTHTGIRLSCSCGLCPVTKPPPFTLPPLTRPLGDADHVCHHELCWCKMRRWSSRPIWCVPADLINGHGSRMMNRS
uniref:Secreted protein n=1 Tax=Plectus sambesii TaxID=2011161 RepID=A0A914W3V1_9BILA